MAINNRTYYKANPSLKAANVNVQYTEEQVQEYMKCSQNPVYFIENYAKIISLDVGVILFKLYPYQRRLIEAIHNNNRVIGRIFRQAGKALPLDTPIATINGLVPMADIVEGSQVYGPDGKLCTVTAVTDPHEVNMFKITFDDGNEVICCEDHQWTVTDRHNTRIKVDGKYQPATLVMTTKDMYNSKWKKVNNRGYTEYAYYIPNTEPVQYPTKEQLIEPYLLGVWLGDGSSNDPSITTHIDHIEFLKEQGIELIPRKSSENRTAKTEKVKSLNTNDLRHYDLLKNKHIPYDYLFGDVDQRIKLLQGLMDTDGFISKNTGTSHIQLGKHNMRLLDDVYTLLCSLGLKVTKMEFPKTNSIRYSFSCPRSQFDVCRIPHKLERQPLSNPRWKYINSRTIQNIEPLNERMMGKCIQVDSESNSYLCTNSFIPTHNSQLLAAYMVWYILFNEHKTAAVLANKQDIAVEILGRVQFIIENLPPWLQQGIVEWNKKSIELENGSSCFAAATSPSAIRGKSCVTGDTTIIVAEDNIAHTLTINDFLARDFKAPRILTEKGLRLFDGFICQGMQSIIRLEISNGLSTTYLDCTLDHELMNIEGVYIKVADLKIGDLLVDWCDEVQKVLSISRQPEAVVYDALNVEDTHSYITNGLVSHNCSFLALDEFAHLDTGMADEFIKSVFPTISSAESAKMVLISTPSGLNHFYKLWHDAEHGMNDFVPVEGKWQENPNRTQEWADKQLKELGKVGFQQEIECIGGETLITVKDITTGKVFTTAIQNIHESLDYKDNHPDAENWLKINHKYEIMTPTGFQPFIGVNRVKKFVLVIKTTTSTIRVSQNHVFIVNDKQIVASTVRKGHHLALNEKVLSVTLSERDYLYDPVNVGTDHIYYAGGLIHHNCSFIGSSYTLIDGNKLATIPYTNPMYHKAGLEVFKKPVEGNSYVISIDTSRGVHQDFSAFTVVDVTKMPYEVVVVFKDNTISTLEFPHLIFNTARQYNNAYLLVEVNDLGEEVSNTIWYEYEYENIYFTKKDKLTEGRGYPGVRTTSKVKMLGCSVLKDLIEKDQLVLNSFSIIEELGLFVLKNRSYATDDPVINDDLCTTLWLFAWLTKQNEFQELVNIHLRSIIAKRKQEYIDQSMTPFMFYDDGKALDNLLEDSKVLPSKEMPNYLTSDQIELLMS